MQEGVGLCLSTHRRRLAGAGAPADSRFAWEGTFIWPLWTLYGDALALSAFYVPSQPEAAISGRKCEVYVFERAGNIWKESFRFSPEGSEGDFLFLREVNVGASVALGGFSGQANLLAVGLPGFPDWSGVQDQIGMFGVSPENPEFPESHHKTGAVYIFEREESGGWN